MPTDTLDFDFWKKNSDGSLLHNHSPFFHEDEVKGSQEDKLWDMST